MTPNRSLALSIELKALMRTDLLHSIDTEFPFDLIERHQPLEGRKTPRDRVYNTENTLLTMILSALSEDKSLKQSVIIFKEVFELKGARLRQTEELRLQKEHELQLLAGGVRKRGRPRHFLSHLPKSKLNEVSDNTAAYTKARGRLEIGLAKKVFDYSADLKRLNGKQWHGTNVAITDGTYFQMQDTKALKEKYFVKEGDGAYPQALLQCVLWQGSGQIMNFQIGTRHQSELELVKPLIGKLAAGTLLLADDLYSTYAIFSLIQMQGCHIIVPGKRERNYTVIQKIADGDEIVILDKTKKPDWLSGEDWRKIDSKITMRRISYPSFIDESKEWVLFTTITNEKIAKEEIILKYATRWDIEITIREIKTIMDINIARSKTEEMVFKEMTVALTAYNIIRKLIAKSVDQTDFSPQGNFVQKCFENNQGLLIDKKGRIYQRWSPGRTAKNVETNQEAGHIKETRQKIHTKS
jgi:hypothetical protein